MMGRKSDPRRGSSIDGFIPNRKGRVIREPFKKTVNSPFMQPINKPIGVSNFSKSRPDRNAKAKPNDLSPRNPLSQPGVAWNARMQDPSTVELKRQTGRRPHPEYPPKEKKHHSWGKIVLRSLMVVILLAVITGGYVGFKFVKNVDKVFGGNIFSDISSLLGHTTLKGENSGRVNILLAGDSADDPGHPGANLTDSIMLVSIDTNNNTAFLLSIPRDLWVYIPGLSSYQKINAANEVTDFSASGYPSNGIGQLEQVVNQDLGIPTDYYALVNYAAFKDAVNAVGGITINIQSPDSRGLFDPNISKADGGPLLLPNGEDFLNGQTALNLARARGDPCYCGQYAYGFPNSDFDRTQHQRQMLIALGEKATTIGFITNPIRVGELFDSIGNNVQTDLSLADVVKLAKLSKSADLKNARSLTYSYGGNNPVLNSEYLDGQDILVPSTGIGNYTALQSYYQQLTQ